MRADIGGIGGATEQIAVDLEGLSGHTHGPIANQFMPVDLQ
jgi:hypothetical protein